MEHRPRVVLICHEEDDVDMKGIASWLATSFHLVGMVVIRDNAVSRLRRLRSEFRRVGFLRILDVLAFQVYYRIFLERRHGAWERDRVRELQARYPAKLDAVRRLVVNGAPNSGNVRHFLSHLEPDLVIARCKYILRPDIFEVAKFGTFVIHPGICPEYRNAHGCFWALVTRDLEKVGMTLLKVDRGIDTGPIYLQRSCEYNEERDTHVIIQYQVVLENLDAIEKVLQDVYSGGAETIDVSTRTSRNWGQPWLTAYLKWKRSATINHSRKVAS